MGPDQSPLTRRTRREPPAFRPVAVRRVGRLSPRMVRVTFAGAGLEGLAVEEPAASVRLLLPAPGEQAIRRPEWNGNEFLLPDGRRPTIRTFTPVRVDPEGLELDLDFVIHGCGAASDWAGAAAPGHEAAVSGPGRGYVLDPDAPALFLAGDETAIPALRQLLDNVPPGIPVRVHVEVADPAARLPLPDRPGATVEWIDLPAGAAPGDAIVAAVRGADLVPGTRIWVAGEAAGVQRVRRHLFEERGVPRDQATVRGYWKGGDAGAGVAAAQGAAAARSPAADPAPSRAELVLGGRRTPVSWVHRHEDISDTLRQMGLGVSRPVLVLVGGAGGVDAGYQRWLEPVFAEAIVPIVRAVQGAVIDGGTDSGVMRLMGAAVGEAFPLLGVAAAGTVDLPGAGEVDGGTDLEPHHSHFVLVPGHEWGDEAEWLALAATALAGPRPSVTVLVNGGETAWRDVEASIAAQRPVIVVDGSGRAADDIAASLRGARDGTRGYRLGASGLVEAVSLDDGAGLLAAAVRAVLEG